jgi:2-polyprenyl-6-methoxyphenol hydroxylase-like FAD-dependent oxidoreductase
MDRTLQIAIAGGGIVGLTAALSLHAAGFRPIVYESTNKPAPLGVGINLLPHAVRELTELGLLDDLLKLGVAIEDLNYLTAGGERVWHEPRGLVAGYNWPQIAIHRGQFYMFLLAKVRERLGLDAVRMGQMLTSVETVGGRVEACFVDRASGQQSVIGSDVLIGADGIHSAVRRQFYPDEGSPRWNGVTLWRSTSPVAAPMGGKALIWAGRSSQKFVAYPIGKDPETGLAQLNWVCDLKISDDGTPPPREWNMPGDRSDLLPRFADWQWANVDVPAIIVASGPIYKFPMIDRDPLPQWTFGHVTLMGDAAHPMYPIGSNGATQGIIDARVFAWHMAQASSVEEALRRYEADRREATARIVLMNRQQGPDRVLDLAAERLEGSAGTLDELLPLAEREAIAQTYKKTAGFDPMVLNMSPSFSVPN